MRKQSELINYVLKAKSWKQTELAENLGVSRGQITKWKNGSESLPYDREKQLSELVGFDQDDLTDWCLFSPDPKQRKAWESLVLEALNYCEDGYASQIGEYFHEQIDLYASFVLFTLRDDMSVQLPKAPPEDPIEFLEAENNSFAPLLIEFLDNYNKLEIWTATYLDRDERWDELVDESFAVKVDATLKLSAYWVSNELYVKAGVPKNEISELKHKLEIEAHEMVGNLCKKMQEHGIPYETDYFDFVKKHPYDLDDQILFKRIYSIPSSVEAFLPYEQQKIISLLEENNTILKEIRDVLVAKK